MAPASIALGRLAADVRRLPEEFLILAARRSKAIVIEEGKRVAGSDGMKGKKRRGLPLKARDQIKARGATTTVRIQGSVPAWIWANTGTRPHAIRRRRRGPMRKLTVHHPGTVGRGAWEKAAGRIVEEIPPLFDPLLERAIRG